MTTERMPLSWGDCFDGHLDPQEARLHAALREMANRALSAAGEAAHATSVVGKMERGEALRPDESDWSSLDADLCFGECPPRWIRRYVQRQRARGVRAWRRVNELEQTLRSLRTRRQPTRRAGTRPPGRAPRAPRPRGRTRSRSASASTPSGSGDPPPPDGPPRRRRRSRRRGLRWRKRAVAVLLWIGRVLRDVIVEVLVLAALLAITKVGLRLSP